MCFILLERVKREKEAGGRDAEYLSESLFKVVDLLIAGVLLPMTQVSAARKVLKSCEAVLPEYGRTALIGTVENADEKQKHGCRKEMEQRQGDSFLINGNINELSPGEGSRSLVRFHPRDMLINSVVYVYGGLQEKEWLTWEIAGQMALGAGAAVVVASVAYRSRRSVIRWSKAAIGSFGCLLLGD